MPITRPSTPLRQNPVRSTMVATASSPSGSGSDTVNVAMAPKCANGKGVSHNSYN